MTIYTDINASGFSFKPTKLSSDIVGKKFGRLLVVGYFGKKVASRKSYYECECECGNRVVVSRSSIVTGHTKSCGCYHADKNREIHLIDISGKKYGRLTALNASHRLKNNTYWNVVCDCGNKKTVCYTHLVEGRTKSCGCLKSELMSSKKGKGHHWWSGGKSLKYPNEWTENLKEFVRNRDARVCKYPQCTHTDALGGKRLDVHHINGDKNDCSTRNLISLCHPHHMSIEGRERNWEDYFYGLTNDYEYAEAK